MVVARATADAGVARGVARVTAAERPVVLVSARSGSATGGGLHSSTSQLSRSLHSTTFQLNGTTFRWTYWVVLVTRTAEIKLESGRGPRRQPGASSYTLTRLALSIPEKWTNGRPWSLVSLALRPPPATRSASPSWVKTGTALEQSVN